jgi:hypothetical protein
MFETYQEPLATYKHRKACEKTTAGTNGDGTAARGGDAAATRCSISDRRVLRDGHGATRARSTYQTRCMRVHAVWIDTSKTYLLSRTLLLLFLL